MSVAAEDIFGFVPAAIEDSASGDLGRESEPALAFSFYKTADFLFSGI